MRNFTFFWLALVGAISFGGPLPALAQDFSILIEMTVGPTGQTVYRCLGPSDVRMVDCSGNVVELACGGEAVVVDRDASGSCFVEDRTETDEATFSQMRKDTFGFLQTGE